MTTPEKIVKHIDALEDKMCSEFEKAVEERNGLDERLRKVEQQTARQGGRLNSIDDDDEGDTVLGEIKGYSSIIVNQIINITVIIAVLKFAGVL